MVLEHEGGELRPRPVYVVALAASAGGLAALSVVLGGLPASLPAALAVVQHLDPRHESLLAQILSRRSPLHVKQAEDGERLEAATAYVAPPNLHLLVNDDGTLSLDRSPRVHFLRPSADRLFESLAAAYGRRAVAVVLSGTGGDGSDGIRAVRAQGGVTVAQEPATAEYDGMPSAAVATGCVELILALNEIAPRLVELVSRQPVAGGGAG
ncbi:MAG: chemotaxis protein CheB [Anaerolineae bacterium]